MNVKCHWSLLCQMTYVIGVSKVMDESVIDLMSDRYCFGILILVRSSLLFGEMFM